jgi:hypothetical protein
MYIQNHHRQEQKRRGKKKRKRQISLHSRETTACNSINAFFNSKISRSRLFKLMFEEVAGICAKRMEVVVVATTFCC